MSDQLVTTRMGNRCSPEILNLIESVSNSFPTYSFLNTFSRVAASDYNNRIIRKTEPRMADHLFSERSNDYAVVKLHLITMGLGHELFF